MAGLNDIRARLASAKKDLEGARGRQPRPPAGANPRGAEVQLQAERKRRSELEGEAAEAWAELARARAELDETRGLLEEMRAEQEFREARNTAAQPGREPSEEESRISELEAQLAAERERREDLELALELLQKQQAEDAHRLEELEKTPLAPATPTPQDPAAQPQPRDDRFIDAKPEQPPRAPEKDPADGWGVSLDAFPVVKDDPENGRQSGDDAAAGGRGRRSLFRPGLRRDDRA